MGNSSPSVRDVLESYDLADKSKEVIQLIHDASEKGVDRKVGAPCIIVHTIHRNADKTWYEICEELGADADRLIQHRKLLIKSDILSDDINRPSSLCQGNPERLLRLAENSYSDNIYDGTKASSWVAGATYLDEYIHLRQTPMREIESQFNCTKPTILNTADRLVQMSVFDRAYTTTDTGYSLGELLARRRFTIESLRLSLSETSGAVRRRLKAVEKQSEWQLLTEDFGGKTFYWTKD